eukprot:3417513-Rhodomonas_salina.1
MRHLDIVASDLWMAQWLFTMRNAPGQGGYRPLNTADLVAVGFWMPNSGYRPGLRARADTTVAKRY